MEFEVKHPLNSGGFMDLKGVVNLFHNTDILVSRIMDKPIEKYSGFGFAVSLRHYFSWRDNLKGGPPYPMFSTAAMFCYVSILLLYVSDSQEWYTANKGKLEDVVFAMDVTTLSVGMDIDDPEFKATIRKRIEHGLPSDIRYH